MYTELLAYLMDSHAALHLANFEHVLVHGLGEAHLLALLCCAPNGRLRVNYLEIAALGVAPLAARTLPFLELGERVVIVFLFLLGRLPLFGRAPQRTASLDSGPLATHRLCISGDCRAGARNFTAGHLQQAVVFLTRLHGGARWLLRRIFLLTPAEHFVSPILF